MVLDTRIVQCTTMIPNHCLKLCLNIAKNLAREFTVHYVYHEIRVCCKSRNPAQYFCWSLLQEVLKKLILAGSAKLNRLRYS